MRRCLCLLVVLLAVTGGLGAQVEPEKAPAVAAKAFRHADLDIPAHFQKIDQLPAASIDQARKSLSRLGAGAPSARIDKRSGRYATLLPTVPLVPGRGVGNKLTWADLKAAAPEGRAAGEQAAWNAFLGFLETHQADLRVDLAEISSDYRVTSHNGGDLYQIYAPRTFGNIPVRGSYLSAVIGQGNLTLMSLNQWGDRGAGPAGLRQIGSEEAMFAAEGYLSPLKVVREWGKPELVYVPMAQGKAFDKVAFGQGYRYQLVWALRVNIAGDGGNWEVLVDGHSGEVLSNEDQNHYAEAKGGVLPVTNDGIVPDGVEQPGWPMPFMTVGSQTTDTGGNVSASGNLTGTLSGPFIRMSDNCGSISLTQAGGLDFGVSGGTDCTTPGFGGAGNTHASRTGFYELNRIKEMARGQLPSNSWLQQQLTSNMNINQTCNAFWGGGTVNFYRSGGGCFNTGEIAGVFDHEWGHGLDDNDAVPTIASPSGEGIADIYTALRLNDSCIGRNFRATVCTGFGDPCLTCTGVRDIDYEKRQSGNPHDYSWSNANCGGSVHCVGGVYAEGVWSLWKRYLQSAPYNMDNNTAHEVVNRLTFIGAGNTGTWFSGGPPNGGCAGSSGYMNYLAADDDNGNLNDGTPHMTAIFNAFNDQEIACGTPTVQDSGCAGTPTTAPAVTGTSGNTSASLSWGAVSGASSYEVFRTEGVFACDFGKVRLGETAGTSWNDSGLQNGREYSYVVLPKGSNDACFGPSSSCTTVVPASAPDFSVACSPASFNIEQGQNAAATCTVTSIAGYSGSVNLSCSGNPAGIGCAFSPATVSPTGNSTLTVSVNLSQATGAFNFDVVGNDGSATRTAALSVTVTPEGQNGPQDAVYDAGLGAPRCSIVGSECDSTTLLDSRNSLSPAEPNQPNTLDTCADGTAGSYHSDESNDRIVVRTLDGFDFAEGATVEVEATVWAWTTFTADTLDLYYAADANSPSWTLIGSVSPTGSGAQTLTAQYILPAGSLQAVRANFRYQGAQSSCSGGTYDDADDLVFAVGGGGPECTIDDDCNDGLFCNGSEVCNAGSCESGAAVTCDDGVSCTVDSCNEGTDSCDFVATNSLCDNGLFCDGAETCDAVAGCQAGTAVSCDDGVSCTVDSCNEGTDSCDNAPDDSACDNGLFCDGSETCNVSTGCEAGSDPCAGGFCDEVGDICFECNVDADCDDGAFCNGAETCNAGSCQAGSDPCPGQSCDEGGDICVVGGACSHDADFSAGAGGWTQGADTCTTGSFIVGTPDATAWQVGSGNPGQAFFTANNGGGIGTDDVDGGTCEALSPVVDCGGQEAAEVTLDYYHGQRDAGDDASDGFTIEVLNDGVVVDTVVSIGDVTNNAAWTSVSSVVTSPGNIQVRVRATDAAGPGDIVEAGIDNVVVAPTTAPVPCSVEESFSGGIGGWATSGTCSTGTFVTATPTQQTSTVVTQVGGDHTSGTGNALFTATNSSAGNADVDGGVCIVESPTFSVSDASDLSVWYFHGQRDAGDDSAGDFFLLEVSTDGGATYSNLVAFGDVQNVASWTEATTTIPAGSNVRLRVQASDGAGPGDIVEGGIDDLAICPQ